MANEPTLHPGDANADGWVEYLQQLLVSPAILLDADTGWTKGIMDDVTVATLKAFQRANGLESDSGICGNQTWAKLRGEAHVPEAGTDGLDAHEHLERGYELRFGAATDHVFHNDDNQLLVFVYSVGDDRRTDEVAVTAFLKDPNGDQFDIRPTQQSWFDEGYGMRLEFHHVTGDGPYGRYGVLMQLSSESGGDSLQFEFDKVG